MSRRTPIAWALPLILLVVAAGCDMPSLRTKQEVTPPIEAEKASSLNETASRLHELCGSFLLFHNAYKRLPATLDELAAVTGLTEKDLTEPTTGNRFRYAPKGFAKSAEQGLIIMLAEPTHLDDPCWAVAVQELPPMINCNVVPLENAAWSALMAGRE